MTLKWGSECDFTMLLLCLGKELNTPCIAPQNTIWLTVASAPSVQLSHSVMSDSSRPHGLQHARLLCPSPTPELAQTKVHWVKDVILCDPVFLLPSLFPSIKIFSNESVLRIWWPEYWSFSFSISPSNELLGLISSRIDWFDLAVQGTLKSLLQHHGLD